MRRTRRPVTAGVALALGLLLAACTPAAHDGVATAGGSGASDPSGGAVSTDPAELARQYVECLRDHGLSVADPAPNGPVKIDGDPPVDQVKTAMKECASYSPEGGQQQGTAADVESLRRYAQCMREHGLEDFPDPTPEGELVLAKEMLRRPAYDAAEQACTGTLPGKSEAAST